MRRLSLLLTVVAALMGAGRAAAATYYVAAGGNDANAGTTATSAWHTVNRVNSAHLAPGDTVLFEGGDTFTGTTLMPASSGTAGSPITFASYGTGNATIANTTGAVWVSGRSYLTFDHLNLTTNGGAYNIFGGDAGSASDHITLSNSTVSNGAATGVISPSHGDSYWTIANDTITNTGDSAVIMFASNAVIRGNSISNPGTNPSVTWSTHGIYAKGPDQTISGNDISHCPNGQAVSIRYHGARVFGNSIHDTPYAFAFFDYDTAAAPQGTSYVYGNRLWNISGYGFYYDNQLDPQGAAPTVDFVIASNTFVFSNASEAVNVSPSGSAHVTLANNIFTGTYSSALRTATTTVERNDDWYGAASNVPARTGDTAANPLLGAAPGLPAGASSLVDAGTTAIGLGYTGDCTGAVLSYCGAAPDLGATETAAPAPTPAPTPPPVVTPPAAPTSLAASAVTSTGLTLGWTAGDTRAVSYRITQNGTALASTAGTTYGVSGLACGASYSFAVVAVDAGGLVSSPASLTATSAACAPAPAPTPPPPAPTPDTAPPTGVLVSPAPGATLPLVFTVTATATDTGSGIASLTFYIDGKKTCVVTATTTYKCTFSTSGGKHNVSIAMVDKAGNTGWLGANVTTSKTVRTYAAVKSATVKKPAAKSKKKTTRRRRVSAPKR